LVVVSVQDTTPLYQTVALVSQVVTVAQVALLPTVQQLVLVLELRVRAITVQLL
jgi:hypothetical protein